MSVFRKFPFAAVVCGVLASLSTLQAIPVKFLAWDDAIAARKIAFNNGKDVAELQDLHPDKRSKTHTWTGGEVPPVLVALDRTSPDGKPVTVPVKLVSGIKSPLVLILPDKGNPSGLRSYVIEDDSSSFSWGTLRFINATGKELLVRQDKQIKKLPKTWQNTDFSPGGDSRNMSVQLASPEDLTAILYSAVWEHDPNVRKLIIVLPGTDARSGVIDLKVIPEDRRAIPAPTESAPIESP